MFHIIPFEDSYPHQNGLDCECCPRIDPGNSKLILHNAYDGRMPPENWLTDMVNREHQSS